MIKKVNFCSKKKYVRQRTCKRSHSSTLFNSSSSTAATRSSRARTSVCVACKKWKSEQKNEDLVSEDLAKASKQARRRRRQHVRRAHAQAFALPEERKRIGCKKKVSECLIAKTSK
jgi:hypothetical protein